MIGNRSVARFVEGQGWIQNFRNIVDPADSVPRLLVSGQLAALLGEAPKDLVNAASAVVEAALAAVPSALPTVALTAFKAIAAISVEVLKQRYAVAYDSVGTFYALLSSGDVGVSADRVLREACSPDQKRALLNVDRLVADLAHIRKDNATLSSMLAAHAMSHYRHLVISAFQQSREPLPIRRIALKSKANPSPWTIAQPEPRRCTVRRRADEKTLEVFVEMDNASFSRFENCALLSLLLLARFAGLSQWWVTALSSRMARSTPALVHALARPQASWTLIQKSSLEL